MGGFGSGPQRKRKSTATRAKLRTPAELPEKVVPYYRQLVRRLAEQGIDHQDASLLAQFAAAEYLAMESLKLLIDDGLVETDKAHGDGTETRKHPAYTTWRNAVSVMRDIGTQFGMTVASRVRLGLVEEVQVQSLAELLFADVASDRE